MTEAKTHIGLELKLSGRKDEARRCLEWVRDHGSKDFYEYMLVKAELEKMAK